MKKVTDNMKKVTDNMKKVTELNLGFSDAQNYMQRGNKKMFSEVFVKNTYLEKLMNQNIYYLIGEKGTGKTAYAVFLNNNEYLNTKSILKFISATDYEKFYELKKSKRIDVSGYVDIWKTIILLLLAKNITEDDKVVSPFNKSNLNKLLQAIDKYYQCAFSPEIINALKIVDKSELAAKLLSEIAEVDASRGKTAEFSEQRLQINLFYICKQFSDSLSKIKLKKNITLFIDGIDVRPNQIPYLDYLECIRGLANACWTLNSELFANVRDSKGQLRVVLLLRPDIFNSLNLQNATNKLTDNSVFLEWRTTYTDYRTSNLYKVANKLLSYNQTNKAESEIWEKYFDWKIESSKKEDREYDTAFIQFLKISLSRPRDIQRILKIMQDIMVNRNLTEATKFDYKVFNSDQFQNEYSEYFLSSLKDQLSFYYSEEDYRFFIKFFDFFDDPQFSYSDYLAAYDKLVDHILDKATEIPNFVDDPKEFLQLLYDSNIICAIEDEGKYLHFSYREKSTSRISPEVLYGENISYRFHYGLYKKAKMGRFS